MRTWRWSFAGAAATGALAHSRQRHPKKSVIITELAEEPTHVGVRRSLAYWSQGISEDPLTDPALRLCSRFRNDRAWGGACIATLPVPRRRASGAYCRDRPHHLVCRRRAFGAGCSIVLGQLRLLLYGAASLLRDFQKRSTVLFQCSW
jgi:hypothetical protein